MFQVFIYAWFSFSFYPSTYFLNYLVFQAIFSLILHWIMIFHWFVYLKVFIFFNGVLFWWIANPFQEQECFELKKERRKRDEQIKSLYADSEEKDVHIHSRKKTNLWVFLVLLIFFQLSWLFIWVDGYVILHVWHRDYYLYSNTTLGPASLTLHCQIQLTAWLPQSG